MVNLKNILVGFIVSMVGSLPLGFINVIASNILIAEGMGSLLLFLTGVVLVEFLLILVTLKAANWLHRHKRFTKATEVLSIVFMFLLAASFFNAQETAGNNVIPANLSGYPTFLLGISLNSINLVQIPFWLGWNMYLVNGQMIEVTGNKKYAYISGTSAGTFAGIVVFVMIFLAIRNSQKKKIAHLFKSTILIPAIQKGYPELTYRSNPGIHKTDFLASTLYSSTQVDRYTSEDLFEGKHGETAFRFSEVHAERKETRSNGNGGSTTHYVTIFQGIFMIADFNKSLSYTTRVIQARDGFFEKLFNRKTKVSLENPEFEKIFNTYCEDQVEARYILSTAMMERIVKLQKTWNDKINLSFSGNHIYIAINHARNLFEPDLGDPMELEQVERIFKEINACLKIIDTLDLNTRVWTKV